MSLFVSLTKVNVNVEVKIEREDGSAMRRITLTGEKSKIVMATYLINQTISTFSTAPKTEPVKAEAPVDPKLQDTSGLDQMNTLHPGLYNKTFYRPLSSKLNFQIYWES